MSPEYPAQLCPNNFTQMATCCPVFYPAFVALQLGPGVQPWQSKFISHLQVVRLR